MARFSVPLLAIVAAAACGQGSAARLTANPIRKVVNLLQNLQKKVTAEGKQNEELFDKFECYCKNGAGDLEKSIADAEARLPQLQSSADAASDKKKQLDADLKQAASDRAAAMEAMATATAIRQKEANAYAKERGDKQTNIAALDLAIAALEKGAGGSFLQSTTASAIRSIALDSADMPDASRQELLSFLSGSDRYSPQSGEITGICKEMQDEMSRDLAEAIAAEEAAMSEFDEMMAAKKREVAALSEQIEAKTLRSGELAVEMATLANDIEDTDEALADDKKFVADLEVNCEKRKVEFEEDAKMRAQELVALSDTVKLLNDDAALDLFKKTLPSASASFLQLGATSSTRARALGALRHGRPEVEFIAMAIRGKKVGFDKLIVMINQMVVTLKSEQKKDDDKKTYCAAEFDAAEDQQKGLELALRDTETAMEAASGEIAKLKEEIASLEAGIEALDKSVAEATKQRKDENAEYKELMSSNGAAKELLGFAKNRLNKFYNPKLHKAAPKREMSEEDRITTNMGGTLAPTQPPGGISGTGIEALAQTGGPGAAPETGSYKKSSEESTGVIAMIDLLIADLDKELQLGEMDEKSAQQHYEQMLEDSKVKRAEDSKAAGDKESAVADLEARLDEHKDAKAATEKEIMSTKKYIVALHSDCDWLMKYFDVRKQARADEVDSLETAKATLSGADYS